MTAVAHEGELFTCTGCGEEKSASDFTSRPNRCKACHTSARREYVGQNRELVNSYSRDYYHRNREEVRARKRADVQARPDTYSEMYRRSNLKRHYGISVSEYDELFAAQGCGCAICGGMNADGKRLHVDHCHATGRIRGLLCQKCNHGVGLFDDDPERFRIAARYLEAVTV